MGSGAGCIGRMDDELAGTHGNPVQGQDVDPDHGSGRGGNIRDLPGIGEGPV